MYSCPFFARRNVYAFAFAVDDLRLVPLGVDLNFEVMGRLSWRRSCEMIFTGLPVVSTPYMPAALMPMPCWPRLIRRRWNFEPYSSLPKISGICFLTMPGPLSCTPTLKRLVPVGFDVHPDLGQDAGFFAGVERVVDRFLHRRQQGLARIVEAEQVPVLGEELADRNIALLGGHRLGRGPFPPPASGVFLRRRTVIVWLHFNKFLYRWRAIFGVAIFEHRIVRVLAPLTDRRGFGRPRFLRLARNQVENPPHRSTRTARNSFPARAIRNQKPAVIKRGKLGELYRSHNVFHR